MLSPANLQNSLNATLISGASETISCEMPVIFSINFDIFLPGFTKILNLSTTSPLHTFTAPISIISFFFAENPVVSTSTAINTEISCPL